MDDGIKRGKHTKCGPLTAECGLGIKQKTVQNVDHGIRDGCINSKKD